MLKTYFNVEKYRIPYIVRLLEVTVFIPKTRAKNLSDRVIEVVNALKGAFEFVKF